MSYKRNRLRESSGSIKTFSPETRCREDLLSVWTDAEIHLRG